MVLKVPYHKLDFLDSILMYFLIGTHVFLIYIPIDCIIINNALARGSFNK